MFNVTSEKTKLYLVYHRTHRTSPICLNHFLAIESITSKTQFHVEVNLNENENVRIDSHLDDKSTKYILNNFGDFHVRTGKAYSVIKELSPDLAPKLLYPACYDKCEVIFDGSDYSHTVKYWDVLDKNNDDKSYFAKYPIK